MQWRKEQGYKVYIANTSVTGTSQGQIKNYIENAYYTWTHPPEYLVLVGDTGGTYQVGYSNSSGGDSDYPYTLIDGNDLSNTSSKPCAILLPFSYTSTSPKSILKEDLSNSL